MEGLEILYTVHHFEKNNQTREPDPWSSRQCAVYQSYTSRTNSSVWIFLHLPGMTRERLDRLNLEAADPIVNSPAPSDHPMGLHLSILRSFDNNWRGYIGYLGEKLYEIVGSPSPRTRHERSLG